MQVNCTLHRGNETGTYLRVASLAEPSRQSPGITSSSPIRIMISIPPGGVQVRNLIDVPISSQPYIQ